MPSCRYCSSKDLVVVPMKSGPHHAKLACRACGRMARWLPRPSIRETGPPDDIAGLIIPRAGPVALAGTPAQVRFAESIRRAMLDAAGRSGQPMFADMLKGVTDATWFIANQFRAPGEQHWPAARQMAAADQVTPRTR